MARSMIQRRQEAERERNALYDDTLRRVSRVERPAPDFDKALKDVKKGFESQILRDAWAWRPKLKTRDPARLRLAAARHLFARYAVPLALEQIWLDCEGLDAAELVLRKRWYIAAARGESLFKAGASEWLSRKEVHRFLNPPGALGFGEAFWHAIARSYTDDLGLALRIARSKIGRTARQEHVFWREVARFFCANSAVLEEIDDLCDYLAACHRRDRRFSLKGRTLASLTRQMRDWHRDIAAVARIEAARRAFRNIGKAPPDPERWAGSPLSDWTWRSSDKQARDAREEFTVTQLVTADELVAESRAMHHCVWTYAQKCISGQASIWSMRLRTAKRIDRLLTIELDRQNRVVQVRGFANRLATSDELQVLGRWTKAKGIALPTR